MTANNRNITDEKCTNTRPSTMRQNRFFICWAFARDFKVGFTVSFLLLLLLLFDRMCYMHVRFNPVNERVN